MQQRNKIWFGLVTGILLPALTFVLLYQLFSILEKLGGVSDQGFSANFRERTLAILSIAVNLPLLNMFRRRRWDLAMRGVVISTTLLAFAWVFIFGLKLF
jgi:hypothetical protein